MKIDFTIRATNEAAFRAAWIAAGILEAGEGYEFRAPYAGHVTLSCLQGWHGIVTKPAAVEGADPVPVPGWHCNARVTGSLAEAMTAGLAQTDAEGAPLPLFQRTWAAYVFGLTEVQAIDPESGFPYGAETAGGEVQYGDPSALSSPALVRQ